MCEGRANSLVVHLWKSLLDIVAANKYLQGLVDIQAELKLTILEAQCQYQLPANKKCSLAPKIHVGDLVFILVKFIKTTQPSKKLVE